MRLWSLAGVVRFQQQQQCSSKSAHRSLAGVACALFGLGCVWLQVIDIPNSMTVLPELLPIALEMAQRKLTGVINFTNPGAISHNEARCLLQKRVHSTPRKPPPCFCCCKVDKAHEWDTM